MNWISALHYGLIVQQERLRPAREPPRWFSGRAARKWLHTVREMGRRPDRRPAKTAIRRGLALTKGRSTA